MSQPRLNPTAALFRSITGPERSMTLPAHADALARHFLRSQDTFANQVDLVEYLLPSMKAPEQAQEALEWIAAKWPSPAAIALNRSDDETINDEAAEKQMRIIETLAGLDVDFSLRISSPQAYAILDSTHLPLGEILVQLGYSGLSPLVPTPETVEKIQSLATTCARNGDLRSCAYWIARSADGREKAALNVWLAIGRQKTAPLDDLHFLPPPPASWWAISHDSNTYRCGQALRERLVADDPSLIPVHVQGALNAGALYTVSDEHLTQALGQKTSWTSNGQWEGGALEVALSDITNVLDGRRQSNFIKELTEQNIPVLIERLGSQTGNLSLPQWEALSCMMLSSGTKELVRAKPGTERLDAQSMKEFIDLIPKTPQGAPDASLAFLLALATTSDKDIPTMTRTLPALRSLADEDDMPIEHIHARAKTIMGIMKLFTQRQNTVRMGSLDHEEGNVYLEHLMWRFLGSRLNQHDFKSIGKKPLSIMPAQRTLLEHIQGLIEDGHYPQWDRKTGIRALHMFSHPLVSTPAKVLSVLQYEALQNTPQASTRHTRSRL